MTSGLEDKIAAICEEMLPAATTLSEAENRELVNCLVTIFRAHARAWVYPETVESSVDFRTRKWAVRLIFWNVAEGNERGEIIGESEEDEIASGLFAVAKIIREYAELMHGAEVDISTIEIFTDLRLNKRLTGMRPAISKGGGVASTKLNYLIDGVPHMCVATVSRYNEPGEDNDD